MYEFTQIDDIVDDFIWGIHKLTSKNANLNSSFSNTGLAYKRKVGGSHHKLKEEFPGLEQQIQLDDVMENENIRQFFRQHFRAFLNYLEDTEPALTNHTGYMKKMHKHILKGLCRKVK